MTIIEVRKKRSQQEMPQGASGFEQMYPNIARWVQSYGWIEMGADHYSRSLVRALDEGGMVWESKEDDTTLDATLDALESFLAQRMKEYYA
jgi:hypothetical protein